MGNDWSSYHEKTLDPDAIVPASLRRLASRLGAGCCPGTTVTNLASAGDTLVLLGAYTAAGQYQGMMWVSVEDVPIGATIKVTLPVNNANGSIKNLKAFPVSSLSDLTPVGKAVSFLP